jgi:transposase
VSLDGTLIPSFAFKETTGNSGKHHRTGVKVSVLVEHTGMPLSAAIAAGYTHDIQLTELTITAAHISPAQLTHATLLADRGYDSLAFRYFLEGRQIRPNIALRELPKGHKRWYYNKDDDPAFNKRLLRQRYVVERTNAWLKSFRRLHFRFDRTRLSFEAFLYLGIIVILPLFCQNGIG